MRQKVALTAAHLLSEGDVADMGMGSGAGSHALASLYARLRVVGVDVNPTMVERARERYPLPNLSFVVGDIAQPCFPPGTQEAILDSSVLHHVTSFNGYDRAAAGRAIAVQAEQLAPHGVLIVRDFLDPGGELVWLDLPTTDGEESSDPRTCSTAALFERFAREFRSLRPEPERGFPYRVLDGAPPGWRRYELSHTHCAEFVLRKDYRRDWELEVQEEYTWATQTELEAIFHRLGMRVLASTPIRNPWIVANRYDGKIVVRGTDGAPIDPPATNVVVVGQRVPAGEGVELQEADPHPPLDYLQLTHWERRDTGAVYDLVRRPGLTVDVVPWFQRDGCLHVLARRAYPRPIVGCRRRGTRPIGGARPAGYITEPLNVQKTDLPLGETVDTLLDQFPGIGAHRVRRFEEGARYFPSPGGLQEVVRSVLVQIDPVGPQARLENVSGFSSSGVLRAIEARQALRAAQVGGLPDARLEVNIYELLTRRGQSPGPWIGDVIELEEQPEGGERHGVEPPSGARRAYRRVAPTRSARFLEICCSTFVERDRRGQVLHERALELVLPSRVSFNTVSLCLLRREAGRILIGAADDDLPGPQCLDGTSELLVAPAWRLPREVHGIARSRAWTFERLQETYGVQVKRAWPLGGRYHPSPGATPEVVHPIAAEARTRGAGLRWLALDEVVRDRRLIRDGHLRIVALRAAHALGLLSSRPRQNGGALL